MKTNKTIPARGIMWIKAILALAVAVACSGYLYGHGVSPVWIAVTIALFPGFFRFIYRMACFLVSLAIIIAILCFLIF